MWTISDTVEITTSIGIYLFDGTEASYDVALHRADNAQYLAKQAVTSAISEFFFVVDMQQHVFNHYASLYQ